MYDPVRFTFVCNVLFVQRSASIYGIHKAVRFVCGGRLDHYVALCVDFAAN